MELLIGNKAFSSWSLRAWILLKKSSTDFTEVPIDLKEPGYKAKILKFSPSGKVPALKDGDIYIWDSLAIANYLSFKTPEFKIWPKDAKKFAQAQSAVCEMHSSFYAMRKNLPCDFSYQYQTPKLDSKTQADVKRILAIWEPLLKDKKTGWLFEEFSVADAFYLPVAIGRFLAYNIKLPSFAKNYINFLLQDKDVLAWLNEAKIAQKKYPQALNPTSKLI